MDFALSDEQIAFQDTIQQFVEEEIKPHASHWDKDHVFPVEFLQKSGELGLGGVYVHNKVGGSNLSRLDAAIIFEAIAMGCPSTAAYMSIHNMVAWMIDAYGSEPIREKFLPRLCSFNSFASYCLTEPSSGSDAASIKTKAKRCGDYYIINGGKAFISGGSKSDVYLCMVRTGDDSYKGITSILIEKDTPGLSFGKLEEKLGWHTQPTTMVFFEDCKVPVDNRLGEEGEGFKIALSGLNGGRVNVSACSLGGAKACFLSARQYVDERKQFKKKISAFQNTQFVLSDMLTDLEASKLMIYRAAAAIDKNDPKAARYCAMAKRFATDACYQICDKALQLYGGYGYLEEYGIERYLRDLRVHRILEGTNEIMRLIISREIIDEKFIL